MRGRWIIIVLAAILGILLGLLSRYDKLQLAISDRTRTDAKNFPVNRNDASQKGSSSEDETSGSGGAAVAESPFGIDPGQRKAIFSMREGLSELGDEEWMKSLSLTERDGSIVDSDRLRGEAFIASFFFSTCPGSCKQQNNQIRLLQEKYRHLPIRLVSITVDPQKDTPEVLSAYADSFNADKSKWLFLTGDMKYISKLAGEYFFLDSVTVRGHPDRFCLVDAEGKLVGKYNWHSAEELQELDRHVHELLDKQK